MRRYTLNLQTHKNIFIAKGDIHHLFDQGSWLLMPEDHILEIFSQSLRPLGKDFKSDRDSFPVIDVCFLIMT
jgi:hypothetical protein